MKLPTITKKQLEILLLIYHYRFINRKQIQTILNHKNHRRIHSWLTDLVTKQALGSIYSKKMPENTKPTVYYLDKFGRKLLKKYLEETYEDEEQKETLCYQLTKTYKDSQRTEVFRMTCMALVEIAIATKKFYEEKKEYAIDFFSPTECQTFSSIEKFDAYLVVAKKRSKKKRFVFLYITNRTIRRFIRYRIAESIKFLDKEWEYETEEPLPTVLCICSNSPIRNYAKKIFETKLDYYQPNKKLSIHLTTLHEFKQYALENHHWKQPKSEEW